MNGLILNVYRSANGTDCTAGGITSRCNELLLVGDGIDEIFPAILTPCGYPVRRRVDYDAAAIFPAIPARPRVTLRKCNGTVHLVPCDEYGKPLDQVWWTFGGNYAASCDSRVYRAVEALTGAPFHGALAVHDRHETMDRCG
jgi:hypothetical protein